MTKKILTIVAIVAISFLVGWGARGIQNHKSETLEAPNGDVYTNSNFDPIVEKLFPNCLPEPSTWSPCCIAERGGLVGKTLYTDGQDTRWNRAVSQFCIMLQSAL
jgi:hypothetical protein